MLVNIFVFLTGAMIGSFLNVLIGRLPKEESIVFPSSHCPNCKSPIRPTDNIPLISYFLLKGRCRSCGKKIPLRYPAVELLTAVIFSVLFLKFGLSADFFFGALFLCLLIAAFFTDLEKQVIPDEIIVAGLVSGPIYNFIKGEITSSILGAAAGFAIFFLIAKTAGFLVKKEALGFGDIKLAAMLGAFLGTAGFWNTFLLAYLLGAAISILLIIFRIKKTKDYIPFGPFLVLGGAASFFFGPFLIIAVF